MATAILVLNAGSSSIKFSVFLDRAEGPEPSLHGQIEGLYTAPRFAAADAHGAEIAAHEWGAGTRLGHHGAIDYLLEFLGIHHSDHRLIAVGHRVVHGGLAFSRPVLVDAQVLAQLETYIPLAPLHQLHNLEVIRIVAARAAQLPQVACFDTAFYHGQPGLAQAFALPPAITERGARRYGFHGLSYEYIAGALLASACAATRCGSALPLIRLQMPQAGRASARHRAGFQSG